MAYFGEEWFLLHSILDHQHGYFYQGSGLKIYSHGIEHFGKNRQVQFLIKRKHHICFYAGFLQKFARQTIDIQMGKYHVLT